MSLLRCFGSFSRKTERIDADRKYASAYLELAIARDELRTIPEAGGPALRIRRRMSLGLD